MVLHTIVQAQQAKLLQRRLEMAMEVFERMVAQQRHHASSPKVQAFNKEEDVQRMADH